MIFPCLSRYALYPLPPLQDVRFSGGAAERSSPRSAGDGSFAFFALASCGGGGEELGGIGAGREAHSQFLAQFKVRVSLWLLLLTSMLNPISRRDNMIIAIYVC